MTLMTMISTATPKVTPSTEIKVMTETKVLLGRRYRSASSSSNGNPDMRGKLVGTRWDVNALGAGTTHARYLLPPPAGLLSSCDKNVWLAQAALFCEPLNRKPRPSLRCRAVRLQNQLPQYVLNCYLGGLGEF